MRTDGLPENATKEEYDLWRKEDAAVNYHRMAKECGWDDADDLFGPWTDERNDKFVALNDKYKHLRGKIVVFGKTNEEVLANLYGPPRG